MKPARSPDLLAAQRGWFAACKQAGLDDDARRMVQMRVCAKVSASAMTISDFNACRFDLAGGAARHPDTRPKADSAHARKARALWISLYNLGVVADPRERALAAFVKRQHGVDDLRFLAAGKATVVIDGLKAMATRAGIDWSASKDPRRCVLAAQWAALVGAGAAPDRDLASHLYTVTAVALPAASPDQLNKLIKDLGRLIRETAPGGSGHIRRT